MAVFRPQAEQKIPMKFRKFIPLVLPTVALCISLSGSEQYELTQEQAIAMALEKNFNILIGEIDPEIQKQRVRQEKGAFDPVLSASFTETVSQSGDGVPKEHSSALETNLSGKLPTGTSYSIGLQASQDDDTSSSNNYSSFAGVTIAQSVLKNFGLGANWAYVRIADRQHKIAEWELSQTALDVMLEVVYAYNSYFLALQNAEVAARNRDLAAQLVEDNRKRIEQGMMSPVDIAVAEAELAVREERVLRNTGNLRIQENRLKNLLFSDYRGIIGKELIIGALPQAVAPETDLTQDFQTALDRQPEFRIRQIEREIAQLQLDQARNQQLPDLTVQASYGTAGYGHSVNDSIGNLGKGNLDDYSVGMSLNYPIPNRSARAETAIARLNLRRMDLGIEQSKQGIMLDLHSATVLIETNWNRVQAARKARELSNQMLLAEQKKLQAGTSSTFVVLRLQNDVANAQIQEFQTISDYNISLAQLARLKGML